MKLFLVGGFLGSGKTTAIHQAVNYLNLSGKKAAVITNDQGTQLVDTQYTRFQNIPVEEVSGGCFCCNLSDLDNNIHSLLQTQQPDAIFAESVGSCTDLIATVANPLIIAYGSKLDITLSVFADIQVLLNHLQANKKIFQSNVNYIYEKQLEEAERIVINKIDLLNKEQISRAKELIERHYGHRKIMYQNSLELESVSTWVKSIFEDNQNRGLRPSIQLDYDRYAAGEAEMAWFDAEIGILDHNSNSVETGILFIKNIYDKIAELGYPIGHLKFLLDDGERQEKISFTSNKQPWTRPKYDRIRTDRVVILINARVQTEPTLLREIISNAINELESATGCKFIEGKLSSFKPGYPEPSQRITEPSSIN